MYCPHCGTQNVEETKYCRGCGQDLRLVAQAITKSLPLVIAQRVDEAIDRGRGGWRTYQMFRAENRRPYAHALMGLSALFVVVWILMLGHGSVSFASGFLVVMTASIFLSSVRELLAARKQKRLADELLSGVNTKELLEPTDIPAASVTEATTRGLKVRSSMNRHDQI